MSSVRVLPVGAARCGAKVWRTRDKTFATIVVKATFEPTKGGALALVGDADPILAADEHVDQNPTKSLRDASDLAPYLPRGEVLLFGAARSTGGTRGIVRLVVARGATALVDRRIVVRGDDAPRGQVLLVPLVYEKAAGGPGQRQNPVGSATPLLLDPKDPATPAALGPIASKWPARAGLLDADQKKGVAGKVWKLDDVPPEYFHAAPPSQRAPAFFAGDETIWVDGVTTNGARIEWRLPGVRAEARVLSDGAPRPIPLAADLLRVDTERRRVSLVFRGYFPIEGDDERPVVAAGVAPAGETLAWPDVVPPEVEPESAHDHPRSAPPSMNETAVVHMQGLSAPTLPFGATRESVASDESAKAPAPPVPGAPWEIGTPPPSNPQPVTAGQRGTFELPSANAIRANASSNANSNAPIAAPPLAPPLAIAPPAPMAAPPIVAQPLPIAPPLAIAPPAPTAPMAAPPVVSHVVPVAPVVGGLPKASIHLPPGLGSELLYALRDDLPKEGR